MLTRREFVERTALVAGGSVLASVARPLDAAAAAPPALPTREFGRTGVRVTIVGVGGGSRFYEPVRDDEAGAEIVRRAIDAGVGFVETSAKLRSRQREEASVASASPCARIAIASSSKPKIDARDHDGAMREREAQPEAAADRSHRFDAPPLPARRARLTRTRSRGSNWRREGPSGG